MTLMDGAELVTAADLMEMSDAGHHYELVRGSLIQYDLPGFEHSRIVATLGHHLVGWSTNVKMGYVTARCGYKLESDPDTVRTPDMSFISYTRLPDDKPIGFVEGAPDLAVEILSPNDRMGDVLDKVREYFDAGVEQVWIVVPTNRTVMIHHSLQDVTVLNDADILIGDGPLAGLELPVAEIFE